MIAPDVSAVYRGLGVVSVEDLKRVSTAEIEHKNTKEKVKIGLFLDSSERLTTIYALLAEANRHYVIGRIKYNVVDDIRAHSKFGIHQVDVPEKDQQFYLKNKGKFKKVLFVDDLWSPGKTIYKYIGKVLFDHAKQVSVSGECNGRIMVEAAHSSHGFYRKQQMHAMVAVNHLKPSGVDSIIDEKSPNTEFLGQVLMYLPANEIKGSSGKQNGCLVQ